MQQQTGSGPSQSSSSDAPTFTSPSPDFLTGISQLINASRSSTTRGQQAMQAQDHGGFLHSASFPSASPRTPITPIEGLAKAANPDIANNASSPTSSASHSPSSLPGRPRSKPSNPFHPILPQESFWSVLLPFDTDQGLHDEYVRFDGGIRFERILEDLDAFAGSVAHLHVKRGREATKRVKAAAAVGATTGEVKQQHQPTPDDPLPSIVTASVDGITMLQRFPMDRCLVLQGCVTWVGSSSMEIWIEIRVVPDRVEWEALTPAQKIAILGRKDEDLICESSFIMVARDPLTNKASFVPPLDVRSMTAQDLERFRRGERHASRRKEEAATSLQRNPPTAEEVRLIHQFCMEGEEVGVGTGHGGMSSGASSVGMSGLSPSNLEIAPLPSSLSTGSTADGGAVLLRPKTVPMAATELNSATLTQPQDRNTNGKIFGGYLMRHAYELARACAYLFCGSNSSPFFTGVDTMSFLRPVEIGSIVTFRCKVCYSAGYPHDDSIQLRVETLVHDLVHSQLYPSNIFHFTFCTTKVPLRKVRPYTYREAIDFLDGKRKREKLARKIAQEKERTEANMKEKESMKLDLRPQRHAAPDIVDAGQG